MYWSLCTAWICPCIWSTFANPFLVACKASCLCTIMNIMPQYSIVHQYLIGNINTDSAGRCGVQYSLIHRAHPPLLRGWKITWSESWDLIHYMRHRFWSPALFGFCGWATADTDLVGHRDPVLRVSSTFFPVEVQVQRRYSPQTRCHVPSIRFNQHSEILQTTGLSERTGHKMISMQGNVQLCDGKADQVVNAILKSLEPYWLDKNLSYILPVTVT